MMDEMNYVGRKQREGMEVENSSLSATNVYVRRKWREWVEEERKLESLRHKCVFISSKSGSCACYRNIGKMFQ